MKKKLLMMAIALIGLTGITASAQEAKDNNATRPTPGQMNKMRQPREFTEFAFEGILLDINQQQRIDSLNAAVKSNCPEGRERACCAKDTPTQCADCNKADCKKADCNKADCNKADCNKADCNKADCKKADCNKADCKKADCNKADCKKADCNQAASPAKDCKGKGPKAHRMMRPNPYGEEYVAKVKEILTPDQFAIFEENISNMPMNMHRADRSMVKGGAKARKIEDAKMAKANRDKAKQLKSDKNKASKKETK